MSHYDSNPFDVKPQPYARGSQEARPKPPAGPLLSELAGMAEARKWGEALAQDLADYRAGRLQWSEVDPGCVLHGPPGTGKTTFGKALAATCKVPLVKTSFGEWQSAGEGHLGTLTAAMTSAFAKARQSAPCIFFIDELDSIPARSGSGQLAQYWNVAVNHLLTLLDGIINMPGMVIVGACNHPELLDPALIRAGRLDRMIAVTLPSVEELPKIIRFHLKEDAASVADVASLGVLCFGMSGAEVERMVREARRVARRARRALRREDLVAIITAESKHVDQMHQMWTAVHEAGHAVAALRLNVSTNITVTVVSRKGSAGRMVMDKAPRLITRPGIDDLLVVILAGRAAEEVVFKMVSAAAGGSEDSDLAHATRLAFDAVGTLGLSAHQSPVWHSKSNLDSMHVYPGPVAEEAREMLKEAYERALVLMRSEGDFLEAVAVALIKQRALTHQALVRLDNTREQWDYALPTTTDPFLGSPSPARPPRDSGREQTPVIPPYRSLREALDSAARIQK